MPKYVFINILQFKYLNGNLHSEKRTEGNLVKFTYTVQGNLSKVALETLRIYAKMILYKIGTDLRYIQEILGHKNSKTTEIYTHVSEKQLCRIRSPLDWLSDSQNDDG